MQELHDDGVDAAADRLWRSLHPSYGGPITSWRNLDSIGRSEFGGLVQEMISTYLETAARHDGTGSGQLRDMQPRIIADVTLYRADEGGGKQAIRGPHYGCLCKFDPGDVSGWDGSVFMGDDELSPGETKRLDVYFMTPRVAPVFRLVSKFYLWEGGIVGEAVPISGPYTEVPAR